MSRFKSQLCQLLAQGVGEGTSAALRGGDESWGALSQGSLSLP